MAQVLAALACNLDAGILSASLPLFAEEQVEALEWSFDALFRAKEVPEWFYELIGLYGREQRLIGHGVFFSLFSGRWLPEQQEWLQQLRQLCARFTFDHVTEHFGFMTGADFHHGAPLAIPYTPVTLAIGRDRLARIQDACRCPVGLENLAFAYTADEVKRHGEFLEQLVAPVNGFIILDLHNLYCQLHNFSFDLHALLELYPLHLVREIHISGGSWEQAEGAPGGEVRRDTHDDRVPEAVFELLEECIPLCPQLKFVVLEQLGAGLQTPGSHQGFREDFLKMKGAIAKADRKRLGTKANLFLPSAPVIPLVPAEDETLYAQQLELSRILETAGGYKEAKEALERSSLAGSDWHTERWEPYMLETALQIARKWKKI